MPRIKEFNITDALSYSYEYAMKRNPRYLDFTKYGGNCTNYISQCVYAGAKVMNYTKTFGWYYNSSSDRSPSWTSVNYFYKFLTTNKTKGPFASEIELNNIQVGDIIQLMNPMNEFYHTLFVVEVSEPIRPEHILINANDYDALRRPLDTYNYVDYRCLHIDGVYV